MSMPPVTVSCGGLDERLHDPVALYPLAWCSSKNVLFALNSTVNLSAYCALGSGIHVPSFCWYSNFTNVHVLPVSKDWLGALPLPPFLHAAATNASSSRARHPFRAMLLLFILRFCF